MERFYEGQKVVCISDNFPVKGTTENDKSIIGSHPSIHPQVGETLLIDEIMGDWLRFDVYDYAECFNWWHVTRFRPIDEIPITSENIEVSEKLVN